MVTVESRLKLRRSNILVIGTLAGLSALAWAGLAWQSTQTNAMGGFTMGMTAPLFIVTWTVMMAAMMLPSAAPMFLMFARITRKKTRPGRISAAEWIFGAAYLLIWTAFGVLGYFAAEWADSLSGSNSWLMANGARVAGGLLIVAGVYQATPLKQACLRSCRSPLAFILTSWRPGYAGALRMGVHHGLLCTGCCWLLFAILFPLGMANIGVLAAVTAFIFAEKVLRRGREIGYAGAAALICYGLVVVFDPAAFPGMTMINT